MYGPRLRQDFCRERFREELDSRFGRCVPRRGELYVHGTQKRIKELF